MRNPNNRELWSLKLGPWVRVMPPVLLPPPKPHAHTGGAFGAGWTQDMQYWDEGYMALDYFTDWNYTVLGVGKGSPTVGGVAPTRRFVA